MEDTKLIYNFPKNMSSFTCISSIYTYYSLVLDILKIAHMVKVNAFIRKKNQNILFFPFWMFVQ